MTEAAHFLGVNGLTIGGAGIWTLVVMALGAALNKWVNGIAARKLADADQKRADNEGVGVTQKAELDANIMLFDRMEKQMTRMEGEIDALKKRIAHLEDVAREMAERERQLLEENTLLRIGAAIQDKPTRTRKAAQP